MGEQKFVDFRAVKQAVTLRMALDHYGVNWLRKSGDELRGKCPIHRGEGDRTFHANLTKNAFNCFSCHARGNVLDLVAAMEQCSVRDAALKLAKWFNITADPAERRSPSAATAKDETVASAAPAVINPPLGFQLRLDGAHEYGKGRGLRPETIERFGCGYCLSKGTFAGRYLIPLHDALGRLVGYAGRAIDEQEPKYLFPSGEKGFHKSHLLFNYHRVIKEVQKDQAVVLVEGFFDCMKVAQAGFPCVALLGSSLSEEQEDLISAEFSRVILLLDGDEAGRRCTEDCLKRLSRKLFIRVVDLSDGKQPDMLNERELQELLEV